MDKERKRKYKISRGDRFRYRSRYFTDAGIIGSKEFVGEVFDQVKHLLRSKDERKFTPVGGVEGVYSMKRLGFGGWNGENIIWPTSWKDILIFLCYLVYGPLTDYHG